ncbi:MAG: DUF2218 domain-containing protein [Paracoccaceae bacterium]
MITSTSKLDTEHGRDYLRQLSNQFAKRVEVMANGCATRIVLPIGTCELTANQTGISVQIQASADYIDRMEELFGGWIEYCAFRENANLSWRRAMPPKGN